MSLTATPEPGNNPPRVRLDLTGGTNGQSAVSRLNEDGTTVLVREPFRVNGGVATVFDYEAPFGSEVSYTDQTSGQKSNTVTLNVNQVWLIHPFRPSASIALDCSAADQPRLQAGSWATRNRPTSRVLVQPYGPRAPIVVTTGGRRPRSSTLVVRTPSWTDLDNLDDLTGDDQILFLNVPPSLGMGVQPVYVSIGDIPDTGREGAPYDPVRLSTLPYDVVQAPFGRLRALWTWESIEETFATTEDADAAFETWEDQETGTRRA